MNEKAYGAEQTGKREWRAWVHHAGKRHWIGCRDHQGDAVKAARRVWHNLRSDWSGGTDDTRQPDGKRKTLRELHGSDFTPAAFTADGKGEIVRGKHGDIREHNDWYVTRFRNLTPQRRVEIEAFLESRWYGSREIHDGQLFAVGAGRHFLLSMGELIGAPMKKPTRQTEGLPKVASGALGTSGLHADKTQTRYPSMGETVVRVKPADSKGFVCEGCGTQMYRARRGRFCSDRCRKAASRVPA